MKITKTTKNTIKKNRAGEIQETAGVHNVSPMGWIWWHHYYPTTGLSCYFKGHEDNFLHATMLLAWCSTKLSTTGFGCRRLDW